MRSLLRLVALVLLAASPLGCASAHTDPRPAAPIPSPDRSGSRCFPVEALAPADRQRAEEVLLAFSDTEGLYTLANGLKPISSGVSITVRVAPQLEEETLGAMDRLRRAAAALTCGETGAFLHVFTDVHETKTQETIRSAEVVVFHRGSVADTVRRHATFFGRLGITPSADPREVLAAVENAPKADRWRGYGYLYGYPDAAVDFFVAAGLDGDTSDAVLPRDFRRIETWKKYPERKDGPPVLSAFVYAVAKNAPESEADRALRTAAAPIYAQYVQRRARHIRADSTGAAALWREWLQGR